MLLRPTLQARAGFDPTGYGPGISAPYGYSPLYDGHHNGEDWFWLGKESSERLGISTEQSKRVYPVRDGYIGHVEDSVLGLGLWQQIDASHRFYWWHLRDRSPAGVYSVNNTCGRMGRTGSGAGNDEHLHSEVRRAPYRKSDRINPAPFFAPGSLAGGDGTPIPTQQEESDMRVIAVPAGSIGLIGGHGEPVVFTNYATQGFLIEALVAAYGKVVVTPDQFTTHINFQKAQAKVNSTPEVTFDVDRAAASIAAKLLEQNGVAPTAEENAAAIARALGPDFAAIPGEVADEFKARL